MKTRQTDFPELEGKTFVYDTGERLVLAVIAGCCLDIGISIVAKEDPTFQLICLPKKQYHRTSGAWDIDNYEKEFYGVVDILKHLYLFNPKTFDEALDEVLVPSLGHTSQMAECPFSI